jgi:hypothetical protein
MSSSFSDFEFIRGFSAGISEAWTAGRLCDFETCDRPDLKPVLVNGWFWAAVGAGGKINIPGNGFHDWGKNEFTLHRRSLA